MNTTIKKILLVLLLAILAALCLWWKAKIGPAPAPVGNSNNTQQSVVDTSKIKVESFEDTSIPGLEIKGKYPTGVIGSEYIKGQIDAVLAQFKLENDPARFSKEDLETFGPRPDHPYSFVVDYKSYSNAKYLTHRLDIYRYTGGAHGGTSVSTYTYGPSGRKVNAEELFVDQNAVAAFSGLVQTKALALPNYQEMINTEWLADGAGPDASNFHQFAFDGDNLVIVFQQYSIAPYAAGIIEVPIPLTELQGILKPEFLQ